MDRLFIIALCTIPFDNLLIAPSRGWATISPILFFVYVVLNIKQLKIKKKTVGVIILLVVVQLATILFNGLNVGAFIDSLETLCLGVTFYYALQLRYLVYKRDANRDAMYLYKAYIVSFIYGLLKLTPLAQVLAILERRSYARLAFSFTEPSFISLHIFGVLFLFTYLVTDEKLANKMIGLGMMFLALAIVTNSSSRCVIDVAMFFVLFVLSAIFRYKKYLIRNLSLFVAAILLLPVVVSKIPRINNIIRLGVYGDASLASRWFRCNASIHGMKKHVLSSLFGFGLGNMYIPFNDGYDVARMLYRNPYISEVEGLRNASSISAIYNFPIKIVMEFGLVVLIYGFLFLLYKKGKIDVFALLMTLWLYMQFDSYAFYSIWMMSFVIINQKRIKLGKSYFELINKAMKWGDTRR